VGQLTYKDAGVDIEAGHALVERVKATAKRTRVPGVMAGLGGFGALFELPIQDYQHPVLVSATDGVGTKLKLAQQLNQHDTIGIDLVAMCVNDLVVCGAKPLYFLDYFATGQLDVDTAGTVIDGIGEGCLQAGCALTGGETAEMPGMYQGSDYDLAGFAVGIVEKANIIDGTTVKPGDVFIGLASSGPHANGYSLIRRILEKDKTDLTQRINTHTLADALIAPTRIYVKSLLSLCETVPVKAIAHITGGGFAENIPRVLPEGCHANIDHTAWQMPDIFQWLQNKGDIETDEMLRTFNCGVGMVVCVAKEHVNDALKQLKTSGETAFEIGTVV